MCFISFSITDYPRLLPDLYEASIAELQEGLEKHKFTSVDLVRTYLARIDEVNLKGPALRAVIETSPSVLSQAAVLDAERRKTGSRGPLHGIPILLKDNIATDASDGMHTTAGSYALLHAVAPRAATAAARLQLAGALILGKTNLSEWANFRGTVPSGFSARGGQTTSPYLAHADPNGSSSGSGVAIAVGLAAGALGTETDGSITSPSGRNNIVGIKPTVGLTSRAGVIPISKTQDSVGPMARCVADAAVILTAIAGRDPLDPATLAQPEPVPDYLQFLKRDGLKGVRLGIPRRFMPEDENIMRAFEEALETIKGLGAEVVDPAEFENTKELWAIRPSEHLVMETEMKMGLKEYISGLTEVPTGVKDLADLIQFNIDNADKELITPYYDSQWRFIAAQERDPDNAEYAAAIAANAELGGARGIDATLQTYKLSAILLPANGFAAGPAAIAGYPIMTVPLGFQPEDRPADAANPTIAQGPGLPFGISFVGTAYSEAQLIQYAYAYEQATQMRLRRRAFPAAIPKTQLDDVLGMN
ncbi:amidase signature enzyme [Auriscalpium vulgare]|uniref:Amidase signature enzyme n=1 Tax=Auriscalpium vulgare TaxID=40419 RepID=A0ACB8RZ48_9AGAM|nr:amidase signature enzyme [Auriscalpium vulgare]